MSEKGPGFYSVITNPDGKKVALALRRVRMKVNTTDFPPERAGVDTSRLTLDTLKNQDGSIKGYLADVFISSHTDTEGNQLLSITDAKNGLSISNFLNSDYILTHPDIKITGSIIYGNKEIPIEIVTGEERVRRGIARVHLNPMVLKTVDKYSIDGNRLLATDGQDLTEVFIKQYPSKGDLEPPFEEILQLVKNFPPYHNTKVEDNEDDREFNSERVWPVLVFNSKDEGLVIFPQHIHVNTLVIPREIYVALGNIPIEVLYCTSRGKTIEATIERSDRRRR